MASALTSQRAAVYALIFSSSAAVASVWYAPVRWMHTAFRSTIPPVFFDTRRTNVCCSLWKLANASSKRRPYSSLGAKVAIVGDSFCDVLASVGSLPVWGSDVVTSRPLEMVPGGSALNTAVQLDNLCRVFGASPAASVPRQAKPPSVVLHSVVGRDSFGNFLRRALDKTGVYLSSPSDKSIQTGACICISGQRDRAFITFRGAVNDFNMSQIDLNELYSSQAVHIAGFFNCPGLWPALPEILQECRVRGILTILTPQFDATEKWEGLEKLWSSIDVIIPNEVEAAGLSKCQVPRDAARWFLDKGVGTVVITLGEKGAYAARRLPPSGSGEAPGAEGVEEFQQPCVPIDVRDTTGAGDAFCAGFAFALLQSQGDVRQAVRWGCAMGRAVVGCYGASTLPTREAILEGLGKGVEAS